VGGLPMRCAPESFWTTVEHVGSTALPALSTSRSPTYVVIPNLCLLARAIAHVNTESTYPGMHPKIWKT